MQIEFPVSFNDEYRIVRQPHGSKGPTFDEVYKVNGLSATIRWDENGRKDPKEWFVSFSREEGEGEYKTTCSLSAMWKDGKWFRSATLFETPLDWKMEKVI